MKSIKVVYTPYSDKDTIDLLVGKDYHFILDNGKGFYKEYTGNLERIVESEELLEDYEVVKYYGIDGPRVNKLKAPRLMFLCDSKSEGGKPYYLVMPLIRGKYANAALIGIESID